METKGIETFYPANREQWRQWLEKNHDTQQSVYLILYRKNTGIATISRSDTVDEALCFGWIDSTSRPLDDQKFLQLMTRRKPTSVWSKINKAKVAQLIADNLMTTAGYTSIEIAKKNGSWNILDEVEELIIPPDLEKAFRLHKGAKAFFAGLSKSTKKAMLQWLVLAKRPETRQQRITEIASKAGQQLKPKQF
ncbi:YdeI/OmpD-associated family protein [Chitinophaga rhizophila]|uniref:YdeI/OmpD-associated family protein n=1 Tax=Chitinophaga rhizophila TaxID=2866212 RepID=A0ABS7GHI7_9BACT|nr:YdeI/OmpD-associated family protein [Chitinophaga rhizophila]MBW8687160.1 YdeI/OmpD-associated family protein [Chitinophaga rhizophila]